MCTCVFLVHNIHYSVVKGKWVCRCVWMSVYAMRTYVRHSLHWQSMATFRISLCALLFWKKATSIEIDCINFFNSFFNFHLLQLACSCSSSRPHQIMDVVWWNFLMQTIFDLRKCGSSAFSYGLSPFLFLSFSLYGYVCVRVFATHTYVYKSIQQMLPVEFVTTTKAEKETKNLTKYSNTNAIHMIYTINADIVRTRNDLFLCYKHIQHKSMLMSVHTHITQSHSHTHINACCVERYDRAHNSSNGWRCALCSVLYTLVYTVH